MGSLLAIRGKYYENVKSCTQTKNRMRVHFCKENMTIEEADKADAYLKSISGNR